ncbi:hypothetical protein IW261DRAFT_1439659 [Armillaria novae-zelandiae]|uniref:Uncharacterized protein n=1 Tax=Armillaria novae-zelandiae TaxID=153914 RepID=A0AA39UGJ1_9AGAR|nr:hypothetical protein IW261DRAFT_1439659 [Armillaria novae-zelandiae]
MSLRRWVLNSGFNGHDEFFSATWFLNSFNFFSLSGRSSSSVFRRFLLPYVSVITPFVCIDSFDLPKVNLKPFEVEVHISATKASAFYRASVPMAAASGTPTPSTSHTNPSATCITPKNEGAPSGPRRIHCTSYPDTSIFEASETVRTPFYLSGCLSAERPTAHYPTSSAGMPENPRHRSFRK